MVAERIVSKEDRIKMFEMRLNGKTLQQIGDAYGISRERVRQILNISVTGRKKMDEIKYRNLAGWMIANNETPTSIAKILKVAPGIFRDYLKGKRNMNFRIETIRQLMEITGLSFDELFAEK